MTTVIIDCNEHKVYTDTLTTSAGWSYTENPAKARIKDGVIITGSGDREQINQFYLSYPDSLCKPFDKNTEIFVVQPKGDALQIIQYSAKPKHKFSKKLKWSWEVWVQTDGYVASGSGSKYAYGALMAGINPKDAIIAASKIDTSTGADVKCTEFNKEDI